MKKYILLLITITLLISCEKQSSRPTTETPLYLGTYFNTFGDTLFVTEGEGIYTQFQLSPKNRRTIPSFYPQ